MPIFPNAQNFIITGSQFTDTTNITVSGPTGIDILFEASYPEAAHDARDCEYSSRCFPGTREQYIQDIVNWAIPTIGDRATPIYWMKGPAGVGKSAVAQTCAEQLKDRENLGAAFFFSITGRNKPEKFFPSIAYQLSTMCPPYRDLIDEKIRRDRSLVMKAMSSQFRYLIDEPLRELRARGEVKRERIVVIVDGLDECDGTDAQCEIIRIITLAVSDDALPLCWAFFSRPEPHIEAAFATTTVTPRCHKVELPISRDADGEIELYLRNSFENIVKRHNPSMESQWPSTEEMEILVSGAGGSFIYATTVIRFVNHVGSFGPQRRLRAIIDMILNPHAGGCIDTPFAALDAFYTLILQRIHTEISPSVHLLLALVCQWGSLGAILAANILGLSKDEFETVCRHASAIVHFQGTGKDFELDPTVDPRCTYTQINPGIRVELDYQVRGNLGGQVAFYHKSFRDFLRDPTRSGSYCVKGSEAVVKHHLKRHLYFDRTYCWEGSELILAPGVTDSGSSLSYPYTNELVNSLIKARVYINTSAQDLWSLFVPNGVEVLDANSDFRKYLHIATHLRSEVYPFPKDTELWGRECYGRCYPGVEMVSISLAAFDISEFKLLVKRRKQVKVIQRYHPKWSSRIKSLFHGKTRERFESAIYRMGHDEKSIFWYWEIDYELGYYREFRTIDLAEGEKRFREEDFDSWPE